MSRLSEQERAELIAAARKPLNGPPLRPDERFVAPTPEARHRYIVFATQAARFYRGDKPVRFIGDRWKL
ncbi:MAG: hypothetical protein Kow0020_09610 [Wenzhouxiangellaceae bacterium]